MTQTLLNDTEKLQIKEVMQDVNLLMFNCKLFSFTDMKNINKIIDVVKTLE